MLSFKSPIVKRNSPLLTPGCKETWDDNHSGEEWIQGRGLSGLATWPDVWEVMAVLIQGMVNIELQVHLPDQAHHEQNTEYEVSMG